MNKKSLSLLSFAAITLFIAGCSAESAQPVEIFPTPQSVEWGAQSISFKRGVNLIGGHEADVDAVELLSTNLELCDEGVELIVGERGDGAVAPFEGAIPNRQEGYYLSVSDGKIVVAGNDERGTFYGMQTLLQIIEDERALSVEISDFPDVMERGMIEGYYGNPLSYEERIRQFEFYGRNKMNVYIYGPKDDPYHGFSDQWREFYPTEEAQRIKSLIELAAKNKVHFVWAVHPGNDINWTAEDYSATITKFEAMYELGVRSFAVFFDDISGVGTDPTRQADYINYLQREFVDKKDDVSPIILCPTQYNQSWSSGDYLDILGSELHPDIRVMWTGKSVCRMIDDETMEWINNRLQRKAYIWLNYPVTDYVIDHLLMGAFVGNSQTIADDLGGFVSNPMEYGEASNVALFSIGDYTWNMKAFDPQRSWEAAMKYIMPENYDAFKIFCENNVDLGVTYHALRMPNESALFATDAEIYLKNFDPSSCSNESCAPMAAHFASFREAVKELKQSDYNPYLIEEITPWLDAFDIVAQKGETLLTMHCALINGDTERFVTKYLKLQDLEQRKKSIRSRDFEGSIKSPNPKPANEVVVPFLKSLEKQLVKEYRENYDYRLDVFQTLPLEDGNYYIKANGGYLSSSIGEDILTFKSEMDSINPQRQEWSISFNPDTDRYKIVSAHNGRFVNERAILREGGYNPNFHNYSIYKGESGYAIQNGSEVGENCWNTTQNGIKTSDKNPAYVFEFERIE